MNYNPIWLGEKQSTQQCPVDDVIDLIESKPDNVELILTGRNADKKIIDMADLVTNMQEVKHYYQEGIRARRGIEF